MRHKVTVSLWQLIAAGIAFVVMAVMFWSVKRRRAPRLELEETALEDLKGSVPGLTQSTLTTGNKIELIQNGAFWDRVFADIENAEDSVNYATFLSRRGKLTRRMAELLCCKAEEGVQVRMMLDGTGGRHFGGHDLRMMRKSGVHVRKYHPIRFSNLGVLNQRDHRKLVIIDGRIGYVGGHCLTDNWLGDAEDRDHFRDISARVEGPVVAQLQSAFVENWVEETGEVTGGEEFFPKLERVGESDAHAVWISPAGAPSSVKILHYILIRAAEKRITIQNPYFLPDPAAIDALVAAAKRGVEVRIMIPGAHVTDEPLAQHASHHHYGDLLKGGVKLYDYNRTLLHQKVVVIDGRWAALGSTNFDDRSFEINDEISLVMYDENLARELEETFDRDTKDAEQIDLGEWKSRPWSHKLLDFFAFTINEQL